MDIIETAIAKAAARLAAIMAKQVSTGARVYRRERDLPKLIRIDAGMSDLDIIDRLSAAICAAEQALGLGHWTASSARTLALRQACAGEEVAREARLAQAYAGAADRILASLAGVGAACMQQAPKSDQGVTDDTP
jgi:hypothetical protein